MNALFSTNDHPVTVVIPHYDRLDDTATCCRSLAAQTEVPARILIVDNGSPSHSEAELAHRCPNASVIRLPVNRGFAGAANAGIAAALERPACRQIWLLNNDTVCDPDALERLMRRLADDARLAAVGCAMCEGSEDGACRLVQPGKRLRPPLFIPRASRSADAVDYLCGACLLIRREALEEIGRFDEAFFFFFEDADWSFRARRSGWRLGIADGVPVRHTGGATIQRLSGQRARYYRQGHVRFLRRHARWPFLAALPAAAYRLAVDLLAFNGHAVRGTLSGFRDGWR